MPSCFHPYAIPAFQYHQGASTVTCNFYKHYACITFLETEAIMTKVNFTV